MKDYKWRIEVTEHQLRLMAQFIEDCHRFIGGQMELSNSTACLKHYIELNTLRRECGSYRFALLRKRRSI